MGVIMKIDCGFWDKDGNYKEDIQEVEMLSVEQINLLQGQNEGLKKQNVELQRENAILKEENYNKLIAWEELQADNKQLKKDKIGLHSEIKQLEQENYGLNQELLGYKKGVQASEIIELKQTLQEIKAIAKECTTCGDCSNCKYCEDCDTDLEEQALGVCKMILDLITKAEEE